MPFDPILESDAEVLPSSGLGDALADNGTTFAELVAELDLLIGVRDDVTPERLKLWINDAYRDFSGSELMAELPEFKGSLSFDLIVGQPLYLLPDEVRAIRSPGLSLVDTTMYPDTGGRPLEKIDLPRYRQLSAQLRSTVHYPCKYFRERKVLVVWPDPTSIKSMTLDFWIRPVDLSADDDCPMFPPEWQEGLKLLARAKAFMSLGDERQNQADNDYVTWIRRRTSSDELDDQNRASGMQPVRSRSQLRGMRGIS